METTLEVIETITALQIDSDRFMNANTAYNCKLHVSQFNKWLGGRPVSDDLIREYFLEILHSGDYQPATIAGKKNAIKKAVMDTFGKKSLAAAAGITALFKEIEIPRPESKMDVNRSYLTRPQVEKLFKDIENKKLSLIFKSLYNSGFRISEFLNIKMTSVIVREDFVDVKLIRKGGKGVTIQNAIPRKLYEEILKTFPAGNEKTKRVFLFQKNDGSKYSRQYISKMLNVNSLKILDRSFHCHGFRHSHATALIKNGVPLNAVADRLSHSDPGTTAKYYIHATVEKTDLKKVMV